MIFQNFFKKFGISSSPLTNTVFEVGYGANTKFIATEDNTNLLTENDLYLVSEDSEISN